ncbi:sensor domain-containing protein [Nocardia wallacei]|uniref:PknH-like extracellular domain-containing protein n=1 Tax=Nocardia wallacei TaxID=480035 RepID=A0A7G1KST6_9NOCA|nr:sensor domain-containing protein [Nocardia wallacei]BCK57019.1 hypothetical protein NWFMUON74_47910 [Nocardia wallacei]
MGGLTRAGALLAGAALCAAGCASQHEDSASNQFSTVQPPPVTAPPITDPAQLQTRLLTVADLPPEYTRLDDGAPGNGATPQDTSRTDPPECAKVLAAVGEQYAGASARGAAGYATPDFASIDIDAASYPGNGAAQAFSAMQDLLRRCATYSGTDADGVAVDYRVSGLAQPRTGDASVAFQVQTTSEGLTLHSAAALVLVGSSVVQIAETAPQPIDAAAFADLTAKQAQRLRG